MTTLSDMAIETIARAMYKWDEGDHDARMTAMTVAKVAIKAHEAALAAAGFVVVPVEPSLDAIIRIAAVGLAQAMDGEQSVKEEAREMYAEVIAAARRG